MPGSASSGSQLGRYEVLQTLSAGSTAELLLARTTGMQSFERHVVIKRIRPELAGDQRYVQSFLEEARLAASLHHQNIVQVYDVGEHEGTYFFAMEYVHGEDLRRLIARARERGEQLPLAVVIAIVSAAAAGLHHAHDKVGPDHKPLELVHRDISPGNILVGYDGSVKLVDFGLAKAAMRTVATRAGRLKGKASYMSPEQCMGRDLDRRSDVFGLGIVLYELATASRLFKAANEFLSMSAVVLSEVPPPSRLRPDLPHELDDIVLRALAKAPEARYPTAEALRAALEQLAVAHGLRTSPKALADYMREAFGERLEPWRADATSSTHARFDESQQQGVVAPPATPEALVHGSLDTSPIALAQGATDTGEFVGEDATIATPPPDFAREDSARAAASTTPVVPIVPTPNDDTSTATKRRPIDSEVSTATARARPPRPEEVEDDDEGFETLDDVPTQTSRSEDEVSTLVAPLPRVAALVAEAKDFFEQPTARPKTLRRSSPVVIPPMPAPPAPPVEEVGSSTDEISTVPKRLSSLRLSEPTPGMVAQPIMRPVSTWRLVLRENPGLVIAGVAALGIVVALAVLLVTRTI